MAAAGPRTACLLLLGALLCWGPGLSRKDTLDRRFSELKRCVDEECSMLMCRGKAVQDFTGPDCRFINFKRGETVYVYYKLAGSSTDLWAGSIGSNFGYFPSHFIETNHVYTTEERELQTDETDFVCFDGGKDNFDNYNVDDLLKEVGKKEGSKEDLIPVTEESAEADPNTEPSSEPKEQSEDKSNTIPEEPKNEEGHVVKKGLDLSIDETTNELVRETQGTQQKDAVTPEDSDSVEDNHGKKMDDLSSESPTESFQYDSVALQHSKEKPQVPLRELSNSTTLPLDDTVPMEEEPEDFKAYTLLDKETFTDLKTQIGTTADAVVTDDEMTRHVTSTHKDADEDESKDPGDEEMQEEISEQLTEIPLLAYEEEEILLSSESLRSSPSEEDPAAVTEKELPQSEPATGFNAEMTEEVAKSQNNEDDQDEKDADLLTSWGDTIFAIVSGGEHTKEVTDIDGPDSDEDKGDEEDNDTETNNAEGSDRISLIGMQEKESTTGEDLEKLTEKFGLDENTPMANGHKSSDIEHENKHVEVHHVNDLIKEEESSIGQEGASEMEGGVGDIKERDTDRLADDQIEVPETFIVNKLVNNIELEKQNGRGEISQDKIKKKKLREEEKDVPGEQNSMGGEQKILKKQQNKAKSESDDVIYSEDFLKSGAAAAKENKKKYIVNEKRENLEYTDILEMEEKVEPSAENENQIAETHSQEKESHHQDIKAAAGLAGQEGQKTEGDLEQTAKKAPEAETKETFLTIDKKTMNGIDDGSFHQEEENAETLHNKSIDEENAHSGGAILATALASKEAEDEDITDSNELLEDENAASALHSEQTLKDKERNRVNAEDTASELETKDELNPVNETMISVEGLDAAQEHIGTKSNILDSETKYKDSVRPADEVQKEDQDIAKEVKTSEDDKINQRNIIEVEIADARISPGTIEDHNTGREKLDNEEDEAMEKHETGLTAEDHVQEILTDQRESNGEDRKQDEQHESSGSNNSEVEPEYSDSVKGLAVMSKYLEVKQIERLSKYLGQQNVLRVEAMFHDLESEFKLARIGNQVQNDIETALDQILEASEMTIVNLVQKLLEEAKTGNEELLENNESIFEEEEENVFDVILELGYRLKQKYSTIGDSIPLPPEGHTSEMDSNTETSETDEDPDSQEPIPGDGAEQYSPENDTKRPPWFSADGLDDPQPEISLSDESDALTIEETDNASQTKDRVQVGDASSSGATDPDEIGVQDLVGEPAKYLELDRHEVGSPPKTTGQDPPKNGKKGPSFFEDVLEKKKRKRQKPEEITLEESDDGEASQPGESEKVAEEPSPGNTELGQSSTGDSDAEPAKDLELDRHEVGSPSETAGQEPPKNGKKGPPFFEDLIKKNKRKRQKPEEMTSEETNELEITEAGEASQPGKIEKVAEEPSPGNTELGQSSTGDSDAEAAEDLELDRPEVGRPSETRGQESPQNEEESPPFEDIKNIQRKKQQPEEVTAKESNDLEIAEADKASHPGESEKVAEEPSFGNPELGQSGTGDSGTVNGVAEEQKVEQHEDSPSGASMVDTLQYIIVSAKDMLSPLAKILIAALPEDLQPGPDFHGMPWTPILITLLVGAITFSIFFWRTCLSVKSRIYQVNEKQLAEKIKNLIQEKAEILQKISDYDQKIKEAKQTVKQAQKETTDLSAEASGLKDVIKELEDTNQQLVGRVKTIQAELETEREHSMKKQDNILDTQKSVEKLQGVLTRHSLELSEVQIALNEAKLSEHKIKSELHHVQEENARLKKSKEQLLKEAEGWSERHSELSEQIKLYQKSQKDMEEALAYKENEIEVLSNCIMQLKQLDAFCESEPRTDEGNGWNKEGNDLANGDCSDNRNEKMKTQIKQMMDVSRVKTTLSIVEEDRDLLQTKLNDEIAARHELEEQIKKLEHDTGSLQTTKARLDNECKTLKQKVEILSELYQQKEMALQKKLTQEEYERQEKEQKLSVADEKAVLATEEVEVYKQRIKEMEEELQKTERSYKNQIASHEKKAHDNWLIARSAERTLSEEKRESANLRQKLIEVNQKIVMLQRPSIVKPTPGRPENQISGQKGPRSREGSFGPSPVSGGAPSPPLMMEAPGQPSSSNFIRRDASRGGVDVTSGPRQQPHEMSGRMSAPDLRLSRLPNNGPRTSSPTNVVDGLQTPANESEVPRVIAAPPSSDEIAAINLGSKGPPSYPGTPIMNSPIAGPPPSQPPVRFGPLPTRIPYGVHPISAPLVGGTPLPLRPRDYMAGPPPVMRDFPRGPMMQPPPPDAREYVRGPLGLSGHRNYPVGPPPLLHGPRDYPPGLPRDQLPPGARDYLPGPHPGPRNYPGGPHPLPRDYPGGPPLVQRDFPGGPAPGTRDFSGGPPPGLREYQLGHPQGARDFPGGPPVHREYPPNLPQGSRDYQPHPPSGPRDCPPGPLSAASAQRDSAHAPNASQ